MRWPWMLVFLGGLASGCAGLNYQAALAPGAALDPAQAYLYGRFRLIPGSDTSPRLSLQLTNLESGVPLNFVFRPAGEESYLVAVAPGRYQFTQLLIAPPMAMAMDVRRSAFRPPPEAGPQGMPFRVAAGTAYYVGDFDAVFSRSVDHFVLFAKVKLRFGIVRMTLDLDTATAQMKKVYPALERVETTPAWPLPIPTLPTARRADTPAPPPAPKRP